MEKNYLPFIRKFLLETSEMTPAPTLIEPLYRRDSAIRAVVFDIYGTLLISASGDIDESDITAENLKEALDAADIKLSGNLENPQQFLSDMLIAFRDAIIGFHQAERSEDMPYPEVDILEIWEKIILDQRDRNNLYLNGHLCIKCFTFVFEVLCNRIYPMPGMHEVIHMLTEKAFPMGIVSNAQFYTPVILNFFMHDKVSEIEEVIPFDPDLTVFSYQHQRSKPDLYLFKLVKGQLLKKYDIQADEILFVGNDMFRDIYPAAIIGFKTALFAGDAKSLRLRTDKPEVKNITPDYVITELLQILKIVE